MSININSNIPTPQTMDVQQASTTEKPQNNSGVQANPQPVSNIANRGIAFKSGMANAHLTDKLRNRHVKFRDKQVDNKAIRDKRIANANGDKKEIRQAKKDYVRQSFKNAGESIKHFFKFGRADKAKRSQKKYEKMMNQQENPTPATPKSKAEILEKLKGSGQKLM